MNFIHEAVSERMNNLLSAPFPLYLELRKSLPVILSIALFVPLFLIAFEPFDISSWTTNDRILRLSGYGAVVFAVLCINCYLLPAITPGLFQEEMWTLRRNILFILWNVFSAVVASAFYRLADPACILSMSTVLLLHMQGFLVSIIPVTLLVLLSYVVLLKRRIRAADAVTPLLPESLHPNGDLSFRSEKGTEELLIPAFSLLYTRSSDNYCTVVWTEGGTEHRKLIRSTLRRIGQQIDRPEVIRCHRSYIVNIARVTKITGNAAGYQISLDGTAEKIPVSRQSARAFFATLDSVRDPARLSR